MQRREPILKLLITLSCVFCWPQQGQTETPARLAIGVPDISNTFNILDNLDPVASLARNFSTSGLTRSSQEPNSVKFHLSISGALSVSADGSSVFLKIRDDARFINANPVSFRDIEYSLTRCQRQGTLSGLLGLNRPEDEVRFAGNWVELKTSVGASNQLLIALARCPIVEESSSRIFGTQLGSGTNLVSAGDYHLLTFVSQKRLVFERVRFSREEKQGPDTVELLAFSEPARALTALRSGDLDAMVTQDNVVIEKADSDSTLRLQPCGHSTLVARRHLKFSCDSSFSLIDTVYEDNDA